MELLVVRGAGCALLLNLCHWAWARRGGFLPRPSGVLGRTLDAWSAILALFAFLVSFKMVQPWWLMMFMSTWMFARSVCAIWIRQSIRQAREGRVGSPSN